MPVFAHLLRGNGLCLSSAGVCGCVGVLGDLCVCPLAVSAAMFFPARQMAQAPLLTLAEIL